jgi:hypothetical protein
VPPLAPDTRLTFFADLRPRDSRPYDLTREGRGTVDVEAIAVVEESGTRNGEPATLYYVFFLDRDAWLVDDGTCFDLEEALAYIEDFPHSEWEPVKLADGEASSFVRARLAQPPHR